MTPTRARAVHALTAVVAVAALVLQTVLVVSGDSVLAEQEVPPLLTRLGRLVSYFTIQSNLLVAVTAVQLARDPVRDGRGWRAVRAAALVGITVTGLVHFVLLRPLLDLHGASRVADTMLHLVVPVLAVVGWLVAGPRPRAPWRDAVPALVWPVAWLVWTLVVGAVSGWYPYPFLDVGTEGAGSVAVTCIGVTVLFLALAAVLSALDRRMPPAPVRGAATAPARTTTTAQ
ncbi:MAG TPA: Pr6Pr family membrane protein [Ornithinibacter sp.]|nr:Pr6Pr family membrane protein [Ornithinibacter sp.]